MNRISPEAEALLTEILEHEKEANYWQNRFDGLDTREDTILRGCFGELKDNNLIAVQWADGIPYYIQVLKDGYLYHEHKKEEAMANMSEFERKLHELLDRANNIKRPINATAIGTDINKHNHPSEIWVNDFEIFYNKYLTDHPFSQRIKTILFHRTKDAFKDLVGILQSISTDTDYIDNKNNVVKAMIPLYQKRMLTEYDVFISHANKDKVDFVENLKKSLDKLGVEVFYDKDTLEWGDNWKERILNGVKKSEFAIIVISENFFDREWTEKELSELLSRQNRNGQKIILPIIHNITMQQLSEKYPAVADIQAIDSAKYSTDEIALLFAKQLIKRLKSV